MVASARRRRDSEGGFTLIELLVVILIISVLAAIALPTFLGQRGKASDASAKSQVRTAQTAMETYATDHGGSYAGATLAALQEYEPALKDKAAAELKEVKGASATGFELESEALGSKDKFIVKVAGGATTRECSPVKAGSGCATASW
jgi:type IV pilus assembly protein PilA